MIKKIAAHALSFNSLLLVILYLISLQFFSIGELKSFSLALTAWCIQLILIVNMLGLAIVWNLAFKQKSIAQGAAIIILKYPLLGLAVVLISKQKWYDSLGILIGFLVFLISIVIVSIKQKNS